MGRIIAIGMSNTDLVCRTSRLPRPGETVAGESLETFAGGKGANQAVAASRAGACVLFAGAVGDDAFSAARLVDLQAAGVDVSLTQTISEASSGIAIIVVDDRGENQIVTAAGANDLVDSDELIANLGGHTYDVALMTWELLVETSRAILNALDPACPIVLNVAPFDSSIHDLFPNDRLIVVCNAIEAAELVGREVSRDDAINAAREIQALGCRAVVLTLGASGAVGVDADENWAVRAPVVPVVDTTGAGDAFCGAFAAWVAEGATLEEATRAGVAAGSCAVSRAGAQPSLPGREDILNGMKQIDTI